MADPANLRSERKVVVCLDVDIAGSTALGERFDPASVRAILGPAVEQLVGRIEEYGGWVKDLAGDGVLALFGAREAHEDDTERAVRAALAMVDDMRAYAASVRTAWGIDDFAVRVGIDSGLAVLGAVGAGSHVEYGATGEAVTAAADLQSQAPPLGVVVGDAAHRSVAHLFRWAAPREVTFRSGRTAVVHTVEGPAVAPSGRARLVMPLVGRDEELAQLRKAAAHLDGGTGAVVMLIGEAGLGKSRLLEELRTLSAQRGPVAWIEGRCASYAQALPYFPFRDLLRQWLGVTVMDAADMTASRLDARLAAMDVADRERAGWHLGAILGLAASPAAEAALGALSPEARRYQTQEAVAAVLTEFARHGAAVVCIEDLHWSDGSSLDLVGRLMDLTETLPLLIVATQRPEPGHASATLAGTVAETRAAAEVIRLHTLPATSEGELLDAMVGRDTLDSRLRSTILARAEGNPFFLEELVLALADAGVLVSDNGVWRHERGVEFVMPATVERVIISRIDRLGPGARTVLQTASVIGRSFGRELLDAVTVGDAAQTTVSLDELLRLDMLREEQSGSSTYRFKHALIQDAAYDNLLKRDRRDLHLRAAEAMERLLAANLTPFYGVIAHHYKNAARPRDALDNFRRAATAAQRLYAVDSALDAYTNALELAAVLKSGDIEELRLERGRVQYQSGQIPGARDDFETVVRAAEAQGDDLLAARATNELGFLLAGAVSYEQALPLLERTLNIAQTRDFVDVEVSAAARLSVIYTNMLRLDRGSERAAFAGTRAGAAAEELRGVAMDAWQLVSVLLGEMDTADRVSAELVEIHRRHADLWYLQFALFQWAWVPLARSRWDDAERLLTEALDVNHGISDRANEPLFGALRTWVARARGDYAAALRIGGEAYAQAVANDHPEWIAFTGQMLGCTHLDLGDVERAGELFAESFEKALGADAKIVLTRAACHLALVREMQGRHDDAAAAHAAGIQILDAVSAPPGMLFLQGADGNVALARRLCARGDAVGALALVRPVMAAAKTAGWFEMHASACLAAARAEAVQGRRETAHELAQDALAIATGHDLPGLSWRANAAVAALASDRDAENAARERARATIRRLSEGLDAGIIRDAFVSEAERQLSEDWSHG